MNDRVILFCCLALVAVGMIFGINLESNSTTLDSFYKVFGIIAGIGTLLTAVIASSALYTWKVQFIYSERFKALKKLEQIAFECIGEVERYWGVHKGEYSFYNNPHYFVDSQKVKTECLDSFRASMNSYRVDVDFVQSLLSEKELKSFTYSYSNFDNKVQPILSRIVNSYEQLEGGERHQSLLKVEKSILDLKLDIKSNLRKFRGC